MPYKTKPTTSSQDDRKDFILGMDRMMDHKPNFKFIPLSSNDQSHLGRRDLWTIHEAAFSLVNLRITDPFNPQDSIGLDTSLGEIREFIIYISDYETNLRDKLKTAYQIIILAEESIETGALKLFPEEYPLNLEYHLHGNGNVKPSVFLQWARSKDLPIAEQFLSILDQEPSQATAAVDNKAPTKASIIPSNAYEQFIRGTRIDISDYDNKIKITLPGGKHLQANKDSMGFTKSGEAWDMLLHVIGNGRVSLGIIPRDRGRYMPGDTTIKTYDKKRKTLYRISGKLRDYFNKECILNIPSGFKFFEKDQTAVDSGIFKPIFETDHECQGKQVLRELEKLGMSPTTMLTKIQDMNPED